MFLKEKIQQDLKNALKEGKDLEVSVLRLLQSVILNKEKEKRYKINKDQSNLVEDKLEKESQLTDEEIIETLFGEIKKRKESIVLFEKGKREDLAQKEKKEIEILQRYLPEQLSEAEVKTLAQEIIKKTGAKDIKDMGKVMKQLMEKVKGQIDGNLVSKIVKELLQ